MSLSITTSISSLFKRSSVAKKLSHNLISQGSMFTGKWIFNFTLAKLLSPSAFGIFTLIQALGNFFMNLFSFGAVSHLIYGISAEQKSAYFQLQKSLNLSLKIITILAIAWAICIGLNAEIKHLQYFGWSILIGGILSVNAQLFAFFKGLGQFQKEAKAAILFCVISVLTITTFWLTGIVENIHILLGLFTALQCIILTKGVLSVKKWIDNQTNGMILNDNSFLKERLPFGLHEIQGAIYIHVILLILGFMVPESELGMYRAVQLFITPVSLLPGVVSQVTLNKLSGLKNNPEKLISTFRQFLKMITAVGLLFFVIYALFAGNFINWVYDYKYNKENVKFLIMCFSAAFLLRFISSNYGVLITSAGKQSIRVLMTFLSILVSISLTYFLTDSMGVKGAALAAVASFAVITLGYSLYCEAILFKQIRKNASNNIRS